MDNDSNFDLNTVLKTYLKHWKWFVLSAMLTLLMAFFYIRYSIPQYEAKAKIQILEDKGGGSEISALEDLDIFSGGKIKIEDEIEILKSRSNYIQVVRKLDLNIQYFVLGKLKDNELYIHYPFNIKFLAHDSIVNKLKYEFFITIKSPTKFHYSSDEDAPMQNYDFGSNINTKIGDIIILPNTEILSRYINTRLKVVVSPVQEVAEYYKKNVNIGAAEKFSNIVNISLIDPIQSRAIDIINELIETNNKNAITDKRDVADRTFQFINERITDIYSDLSSVDESAEEFKTQRGIADLGSQSSVNFSQSAAGEQQLRDANIQLNIASSMKNLVEDQQGFEMIPTNVGLSDPGISDAAVRYNELVSERQRLLESSNEKNPVIVKLDQQLQSLKRGMQSSLNNVANNLDLQVNSLKNQLSQINSRIYAAPSNERALRDISRRQQTTESLYLYLLQKREESQITFASASPKSKIIEEGYGAKSPVAPKSKIIYLASFILGLLIPFSLIYVNSILDNKIHSKLIWSGLWGDVPVLAEIPRIGRKTDKLIKNEDRSVLAESLRILRTNLDYIFRSKKQSGNANLIFVTSSIPGEGKTLISSNLAMVFANTGKKVLLIGADIRNPKLYTFFTGSKNVDSLVKPKREVGIGLTEYLVDSTIGVDDIINPALVHKNTIDVIYSGKIPPNPTELLMSNRIGELFKSLSEIYDYVVVDTAPLMVVTDTLLISRYANQILYVTKADVTEKKVLQYPLKLIRDGKLKGLSFIVNNVKTSNLGYGGKYGLWLWKNCQEMVEFFLNQ